MQSGIFSDAAAQNFIAQPYAKEAVQLRLWDDKAKGVGLKTPNLEHFTRALYACIPG